MILPLAIAAPTFSEFGIYYFVFALFIVLGFVMLGIFALNPEGVDGAIYQMLNHGVSTGGLFLLVGMLYMRRHTREISEFGGLWKRVAGEAAIATKFGSASGGD